MSRFLVRQLRVKDAPRLQHLLQEWLGWEPPQGRTASIKRAIQSKEFLAAEVGSTIVGFIHFVQHEDVIDGAPNAFITALYVQEMFRGEGLGNALLHEAIAASAIRGAAFIETSTLHSRAKAFYERHGFKQVSGDIPESFLELDVARYLGAQ